MRRLLVYLLALCEAVCLADARHDCQQLYANETLPAGLREKLVRDFCSASNQSFSVRVRRSYGSVSVWDTSKLMLKGFPKDGIAKGYADLFVWNETTKSFKPYYASPGVYGRMEADGVFEGKENDIVLLLHGWHAFQSSEHLFLPLTRMHAKLTPNTTVVYVKWEALGANYKELGNAAWAATRLNIGEFLKGINENKTGLHCVGHSLGGHACAAVCRQFRELKGYREQCRRIVSLDPASVSFKWNSPDKDVKDFRISRYDADYVAVFMTNRNFMGLADVVGDEYITTNIEGWNSEACPAIGKWKGEVCARGYTGVRNCEYMDVKTMFNSAIIPHTKDSCSHMMAPILFMKFLDIQSSVPVVHMEGKDPARMNDPLLSVWSSYVTSRDYRMDTYYGSSPIWYSYAVDPFTLRPADNVLVVVKGSHDVNMYDSAAKTKFKKGMHTFYVFVIRNQFNSRRPVLISSRSKPIMVRLTRGKGYSVREQLVRYPLTPMTTQEERQLECVSVRGYYEYNFKCVFKGSEKRLFAYRSQLKVVNSSTLVPPMEDSCLPYTGWFKDSIHNTLMDIQAEVDEETRMWWDTSLQRQFMDARIKSSLWGDKEVRLCSFWNGCGDLWEQYHFEYELDRLKGQIRFRFSNSSTYTVTVQFRYGLTSVNIVVSGSGKPWRRGVRILPYEIKGVRVRTTTTTPSMSIETTSSTTPSTPVMKTLMTSPGEKMGYLSTSGSVNVSSMDLPRDRWTSPSSMMDELFKPQEGEFSFARMRGSEKVEDSQAPNGLLPALAIIVFSLAITIIVVLVFVQRRGKKHALSRLEQHDVERLGELLIGRKIYEEKVKQHESV